jgi:hypothetical protein
VVQKTARNAGTRKRKPAWNPKRGEIGPQVVAAVDAKTDTGMNRTQAFAEVQGAGIEARHCGCLPAGIRNVRQLASRLF